MSHWIYKTIDNLKKKNLKRLLKKNEKSILFILKSISPLEAEAHMGAWDLAPFIFLYF